VVQKTYPVNRRRVGREGEKGARDKVKKRRRGKEGMERRRGQGPLFSEGRAALKYLCRGPQVPTCTTADWARHPT